MTILESIYNNHIKYPHRLAIASIDGNLTYKELYYTISKFASYLKNNGLNSGETVVIQGWQNTAFIVIILGTLLAGGVIVPVDKNIKENNLDEIIQNTKARFIFNNNTLKETNLTYILSLLNNISYEEHKLPNEDSISDILYTTGTTGKPEGIIHTHKSHYATVENIFSTISMSDENITLILAPLNHSFALRRFYANICHGSSVIILDGILPLDNFYNTLEIYNVTSIAMNPSALAILLKGSKDRISHYKKQLDYIEFSSSPLNIEILETVISYLPNTKMYNIYGSTEAGCMTGYDNRLHLNKQGCIGKANINSNIYILDNNLNAITGIGKENAGFLAIKSNIIMKGYLNNMNGTKQVLRNGYYITKDIVYKDEKNFFYLLGRDSDIISIGGLKIAPTEIEDVIIKYKGIVDCACVGKNNNIAGQVPVLFIVINNEYDSKNIHTFIKDNLEPYKCPKEIHIINEIPKTFNGKILRRKLKELYNI